LKPETIKIEAMSTVTVKINAKTPKTRYLIGLLNEMAKRDNNIEIDIPDESPYNKNFVKEILKSRASMGKSIRTEDLWK
jgi:hypothetical protein